MLIATASGLKLVSETLASLCSSAEKRSKSIPVSGSSPTVGGAPPTRAEICNGKFDCCASEDTTCTDLRTGPEYFLVLKVTSTVICSPGASLSLTKGAEVHPHVGLMRSMKSVSSPTF